MIPMIKPPTNKAMVVDTILSISPAAPNVVVGMVIKLFCWNLLMKK